MGERDLLEGRAGQVDRPFGTEQPKVHAFFHAIKAGCGRWQVLNQAQHPNDRRRVDVEPVGLVVEGDVAPHHRNPQRLTGLRHPLHRLPELPHHLWFLRVAKVEVVDDGEGFGSDHCHIERCFVHEPGGTAPWVEIAHATVAVGGQRQTTVCSLDPQQRRVMTRTYDSVEEEHVVVLLVHPRLRPELWLGQHLQKRGCDGGLGDELDRVPP